MKDVVVVVKKDTKPRTVEGLDVLLVLTDADRETKVYTSTESALADFGENSAAYGKIAALFGQGKARPTPEKLVGRVTVAGIESEGGEALKKGIAEYRKSNDGWYILLTDREDDATIMALAQMAEESEPSETELENGMEDHRKFYIAQTSNKSLKVVRARTAVIYTDDTGTHADAAWLGSAGGWYPKYVTWKFKMPAGLSAPELSRDEMSSLLENNINFVSGEYKKNYVKEGVCTDGEYIDTVLGADWIAKEMRERVYDVFLQNPIVPYLDEGFTLVGAAVIKSLSEAARNGIVATDGSGGTANYRVKIPRWEDSTEEERRMRVIPPIEWEAQVSGAVHKSRVHGKLVVGL